MQNKEKQIEKLRRQVRRFEDKGYFDTAAHQMLANLLKSEGGEPPETRKAKQEKITHGK
jgi:hypothetical protein